MRFKIKGKLMMAFLAIFGISLIMFGSTYYLTSKQKSDGLLINLAGRQRMLSQKMSKEMLTLIYKRNTDNKQIQKEEKQSLVRTMQVFDRTLDCLINSGSAPLTLNPEGKSAYIPRAKGKAREQLKKVQSLWNPFQNNLEKIVSGQDGSASDYVLENNIALLKSMDKAVDILQGQSEEKVSYLLYTQIFCLCLGVLIVVFIGYWVNASMIRPLYRVVDLSRQVAGGDLSQGLSLGKKDEIGDLAGAMDDMVHNLSAMIKEQAQGIETLSSSSSELTAIAEQLNSSSENTVSKANTVASSAEEMSTNMSSVASSMEQTSTNVNTIVSGSEEMSSSINEISQQVEQAREITDRAVNQADSASKRINELGESAQAIGKVTETITSISSQTNLLALNATIEAARAGEAGKGFAVVANEIKELAQQTAEATSDIGKRIEDIQSSTDTSVGEIKEITQIINQLEEIVSSIATSMEQQSQTTQEIATNISQVSQGVQEVNLNVNQSSQAAQEVTRDISEVNKAANEISNSSAQIKSSAQELSQLAERLREMAEKFKL